MLSRADWRTGKKATCVYLASDWLQAAASCVISDGTPASAEEGFKGGAQWWDLCEKSLFFLNFPGDVLWFAESLLWIRF